MEILHAISDGLHILAAITWIGSMIYSLSSVVPALNKSLGRMKTHAVNGLIMKNFSPLTWISVIVLAATGIYAAIDKGDKFISWTSGPSLVLIMKLVLFCIMVVILILQAFVYGPKMKKLLTPSAKKDTENEAEMMKLEKITKPLSCWHLTIGIAVVILAVILSGLLG